MVCLSADTKLAPGLSQVSAKSSQRVEKKQCAWTRVSISYFDLNQENNKLITLGTKIEYF
jgi:hypothetical protein